MCVGNGRQNIPQFKGVSEFKGSIYHSDQHKNVKQWAGKKAVVVGAVSINLTQPSYPPQIIIVSCISCSVTLQATPSNPSSPRPTVLHP